MDRLNQLRRFLSPQVADAFSEGGIEKLTSHRREVTVPFCELSGFTPFAERSEPEDVMQVLGEMYGALGSLVFAQGGTLSQFTGDGMLVIFNDPVPCVDPTGKAVILGLATRDQSEGRVQAAPLGEVQFKGIAKPVPIWLVDGLAV